MTNALALAGAVLTKIDEADIGFIIIWLLLMS